MTIREWIIEGTLKQAEERLVKLKELNAPSVMILGQQKYVDKLRQNILKVGGLDFLLDQEFKTVEKKVGNGGRVYYTINDDINYFPHAKYGCYVAKKSKEAK